MAAITRSRFGKRRSYVELGKGKLTLSANGRTKEYDGFRIGVYEGVDDEPSTHHTISLDRDEALRLRDWLTLTLAATVEG